MINKKKFTFLISSYNRYEKVLNLLSQIHLYDSDVILIDDNSNDVRYSFLEEIFPKLTYIKHNINYGRGKYNLTTKELINKGLELKSDYYIKLEDDLILCGDFLNVLEKILSNDILLNIFSLSDSAWGIKGYVDGNFACSYDVLQEVLNGLPSKVNMEKNVGTGIGRSITNFFYKKSKYNIVNTNLSLCQHDGNNDSKLHPKHRLKNPIVAKNFYDDFPNIELKIISNSSNNKIKNIKESNIEKKVKVIKQKNKVINKNQKHIKNKSRVIVKKKNKEKNKVELKKEEFNKTIPKKKKDIKINKKTLKRLEPKNHVVKPSNKYKIIIKRKK